MEWPNLGQRGFGAYDAEMSATASFTARLRAAVTRAGSSTRVRRRPRQGDDTRYEYAPVRDGRPDPGEVVWTWVPYEEDASQGKDRPVLIIGRRGTELLGLMLTSKDHDRDAEQEARAGRHWMDVGSGGWDSDGRPSEVRLDRLLTIDPAAIRREGASLDEHIFRAVVAAVPR